MAFPEANPSDGDARRTQQLISLYSIDYPDSTSNESILLLKRHHTELLNTTTTQSKTRKKSYKHHPVKKEIQPQRRSGRSGDLNHTFFFSPPKHVFPGRQGLTLRDWLQAKRINNAQTAEVTFPPTPKPIPAGQTTAPKSINTHEFSATAQAHSR